MRPRSTPAFYPSGQHVVRARATDTSGNVSTWSTRAGPGRRQRRAQPSGFTRNESWVFGLASATAFAQAPDGRLFIAQQGGALRVVKNGALLATPFATVAVDSAGERGLIGIALHPASRPTASSTSTRPLTAGARTTASAASPPTAMSPPRGSEVVLLDLPNLSGATNHNGGAHALRQRRQALRRRRRQRQRRPGADPGACRSARCSASTRTAPSRPTTRFATQTGLARAVWAYGLRNPFTFAVQPGTGRIYINDVGQRHLGRDQRRPAGANYGWPGSEGPDNVGAGVTAPLFTYKHADPGAARLGRGRLLQGLRDRRRRVLPDDRRVPRRLPRPVLLRRLRQPLRRPPRSRQRQRRVRVRAPVAARRSTCSSAATARSTC